MKTLAQAIKQIELDARIVYIIEEAGTNNFKVGISKSYQSLGRRLSNLQSGNPRLLTIVHTSDYALDGEAYGAEIMTHAQFTFNNLGLHREWFHMPEGPAELISFLKGIK